jgi:hypothetical protein
MPPTGPGVCVKQRIPMISEIRLLKTFLKCLLVTGLSSILIPGPGLAGDLPKAVPIIEIEQPIHEFIQTKKEDVVQHDFRVFNRGHAPLQIRDVKPG